MDNRQNGEETFVVINTTGEPLTANQNLKPQIMMANPSYSRCTNDSQNGVFNAAQDWEIMETWFWKHRKKMNMTHLQKEYLHFFTVFVFLKVGMNLHGIKLRDIK